MRIALDEVYHFKQCRQKWDYSSPSRQSLQGEELEHQCSRNTYLNILTHAMCHPEMSDAGLLQDIESFLTEYCADNSTERVVEMFNVVKELMIIFQEKNHPLVNRHNNVLSYGHHAQTIDVEDYTIVYDAPAVVLNGDGTLSLYAIHPVWAMPSEHSQHYYIIDELVTAKGLFMSWLWPEHRISLYYMTFINIKPFKRIERLKNGRLSRSKTQYISMSQYTAMANKEQQPALYEPFIQAHTETMRERMFQEFPVVRLERQEREYIKGLLDVLADMHTPDVRVYRNTTKRNCLPCPFQTKCLSDLLIRKPGK